MSKLETNTIDTISGSTTLTLGGTNATTIAQDAATTVTGFKSTGIDDNATSTAITIDSNENVGINTTSPDHKVTITGSSNQGTLGLYSSGTSNELRFENDGSQNWVISNQTQGLRFKTAGTERMRIISSGNVGINTTSPETGSLQTISHPGSSQYGLNLDSSETSGTQYHLQFKRGGTQAGYITSNSATTIAVNNASDERLKENIQNSGSAIQDIKDIQVRQFDWKDGIDTHRDFGFVAQELVNVVPEAVTQGTDELDENGKPVRTWGIDYSHIVPRLVKVCQEQQTIIQELEARITALENA